MRFDRRYQRLAQFCLMSAAAATLVAACAHKQAAPNAAVAATGTPDSFQPNQTQTYAEKRAHAIHDPSYKLKIELDADRETFAGQVEARFSLSTVPDDLALDFRGGKVLELKINGQAIPNAQQSKGLVALPARALKTGANDVAIRYEQTYSKDGRGLYRFKDPEDGRTYLYTQFEAFDANHLFPCFDQPDLKATYELTAIAPKDWRVVSTERETRVASANGERKEWTFPATPKLSPYVFSMHAGPYKEWTSSAKTAAGAIPLRLFARQSLAKYVVPEDWFRITREGLSFYGSYFAYPYPFKKYDQLIVPDFNAGAMENVAAVTFTERLVRRGKATRDERSHQASVILHEMAHMWFGDLVTMRWWNGLWLNESFATYMSALALSKATEFKDAWIDFNDEKQWALREDQLVTTHPINGAVADTNSAFVSFDGITYGKGASALKQLAFYIGAANFQKGAQRYFKQFQFKNTELADFMGKLEASSGKDLKKWSTLWLERQGVDAVAPSFACDNGKIASFDLKLSPPENETDMRPHRARVGLYYRGAGDALKMKQSTEVEYGAGVTRVDALKGAACPDFVYANVGDEDYVKPRLDAVSLAAAQASLSGIDDPLTRTMAWTNLYEMVRDGELPVQQYLTVVLAQAPKEREIKVVEQIVDSLRGRTALYYFPQSTDAERAARATAVSQVETMIWNALQKAKPGSDWQKTWYDAFVGTAESAAAMDKLAGVLSGKIAIKGFALDQDRRWSTVGRLNGFAAPGSDALLASEKERDKSDVGIRAALGAEAMRPDGTTKQRLYTFASSAAKDLPLARRRAVLFNIFPAWQDQFRSEFGKAFYAEILARAPSGDPEFISVFARTAPTVCTAESHAQIDAFLNANGERLPPVARKPLLVARQENQRCVRVRAKAAETASAPRSPSAKAPSGGNARSE